MEELSNEAFCTMKDKILSSCDLSKKGSIDGDILNLVKLINDSPDFVTTSSCSGRIILFSKEVVNSKAGCNWILVSHDVIDEDDLITKIQTKENNLVLKFEPFIMHVSCRTIRHAKIMQDCALSAGYRNSGMTIGKKGKITFAIRSTHNLEVPISSSDGNLLVSNEYVRWLAKLANEKMKTNKGRIKQLEELCQTALENILCD